MTFHTRFEPKNLPEEMRDFLLHSRAMELNANEDIPAAFRQDSLDFLFELSHSLLRRGVMFVGAAGDFLEQLAIHALPPSDASVVMKLLDLKQQKCDAMSASEFEIAASILHQADELRKSIVNIPVHQITRTEIVDALLRDGIEVS